MKLFIFPDSVRRENEKENIKLNIVGSVFHFFHNGKESIIDTALLKSGSSTMVLNNTLTGETYVLYNFREILQVLGMSSQEMLSTLHQRGFMQIDKQGDDLFVKVFLLEGDKELASDINDFSSYRHYTKDYIHPLDYQYSWSFRNLKGRLVDGYLELTFTIKKSDFWVEPLYISHAGQSVRVKEGENKVRFKYIPTEGVYGGNENARQKGRALDVARLLRGGD